MSALLTNALRYLANSISDIHPLCSGVKCFLIWISANLAIMFLMTANFSCFGFNNLWEDKKEKKRSPAAVTFPSSAARK